MATEDERSVSETMRSLARHLNCLSQDEKWTRKRALESIKKETIDNALPSAVLQEVFACLLKSILKCLSDPMERCRELAIQIVGGFMRCVSKPEVSLPYLMPCLTQRLGRTDIVEPAEELRLYLVEILSLIVEICGRHLAPYVDNMMNILQKTITDPFPDVKRESCKCTMNFARCVPDLFQSEAECLLKPLMQTVVHQHLRVRVAAVEATGALLQYGKVKNMEELFSNLAQRLLDNSPQVRKTVTLVVGECLLNFRDRYSYFHKLIPLLLSSVCDDLPEIKALAWELWKQVGYQWENENEDDLKDKMDCCLSPCLYYPSGIERPGLGCRELVVRNLSKFMPSVSHDATDWLRQTRVKATQLLWVLLLHAEDHCTQHLKLLLATLYLACGDSEQEVKKKVLESARLLGMFVCPEVLFKILLPHVENCSSCSFSSPWAPLMVLAAVLRGSNRKALRQHLLRIGKTLAHPDVCQHSQQIVYLEQLLECVDVLLGVCEEDCGILSLPLLKILVTVQSFCTEQQLHGKVELCLIRLCEVLNLNNVHDLYRQHMVHLLQWLSEYQHSWSIYSLQKTQMEIIAFQSGPVIFEFFPEFLQLLHNFLAPSQDPELRLQIFTMLSKLLANFDNMLNSQGKFTEHLDIFLQKLLLPNMVWHAGRTAAAVRTSALSCLLALLEGDIISKEQVMNIELIISPYLIPALEEDFQLSRLLACRLISSLLNLSKQYLNPETLNKIYPELLKRMDDSNEEVRVEALKAIKVWFSSLGKKYDRNIYHQHIRFLFQHLLLYLDDPEPKVQHVILEVLKSSNAVDHDVLQQEVEAVRNKQRSAENCDQLLQYIQSL